MNRAFRIGLFLSSYTPVVIMIFLNDMKEFSLKQVGITLHKNTVFWSILTGIFVVSLLMLVLWLVRMDRNAGNQIKLYEIYDIKNNDGEVLSYFVTFVIPILSLKIDSAPSIVISRCDKYTIKNKGLKADQFGSSNIFYIKSPKP